MTQIKDSELIINPDGSIYHLALRPEEVAPIIITVGDQNRVEKISRRFDAIEHRAAHRELSRTPAASAGNASACCPQGSAPTISTLC